MRHGNTSNFVDAGFFVIVQALLFVRRARSWNLAHQLPQFFRHVVSEIVTGDDNFTGAIEPAAARDAFSVGAEASAEDTASNGKKITDELGVVADLSFDLAKDTIDFRQPVRTAGDDVIEQRMGLYDEHAALECAGSNRSNIIN